MALPKLNDKPKYELVIPSTKQKVKFRPYLVKEEKVLMLALESQDQIQIFEAIADTIEACVDGDIDKNVLTTFDIEYMFVKIRTKSVGESIKLIPKCSECEAENEISIGLDKIIVDIPEGNNIIKISDDINIKMKWPSFLSVLSDDVINDKSETEQTFKMISKCIESVMTEDENMMFKDEPKKDQMEFIESLNNEQFNAIREFVEKMPSLEHDASYKCNACEHDNELKLKGMSDFF
jgi:DNA-directed RNA polymerase subunit RPC12/RpoP